MQTIQIVICSWTFSLMLIINKDILYKVWKVNFRERILEHVIRSNYNLKL